MVENFIRYLTHEKRFSPHSIKAYQTDLKFFLQFLTTNFPQVCITTVNLSVIRAWLVEGMQKGILPRTINRRIATLKTLYAFLHKTDCIQENLVHLVSILKTPQVLPKFFTEKEIIQILDHTVFEDSFIGWRDKLILELLYGTGMRVQELITLQNDSIQLTTRTIKVMGKRRKERIIPFSIGLVPIFEQYILHRPKVWLSPADPFFLTVKHAPCYPMVIQNIMKKYVPRTTRMRSCSPHVWRHTYATHLLNNGADLQAIKTLLGHESLAATQMYTHNSLDRLKKVHAQAHPSALI